MSDRFEKALDFIEEQSYKPEHMQKSISNEIEILRELATEAEQLRKDKDAIKRTLDGAKFLLQINSDTIDQLRKERDELAGKVAELETFIQSRGIELP